MDNATKGRLFQEHGELVQRIGKLEPFVLSTKFDELPEADRNDLKQQLEHMRAYQAVLSRRISRQCNNA